MKYTQMPVDTFENIQLNAGILVESFTPSTGEATGLIGATTGGITFNATPSFTDYGEDIDNCPKNMMELKKLESWEVKMSGTFIVTEAALAKRLTAAADVDGTDATHIIPRNSLKVDDFKDIWWVGDYSNENDGTNAGFIAIHLLNALNTGGFQIKSTDKAKGQFAFDFTGHYSNTNIDKVPFEIYIKEGSAA